MATNNYPGDTIVLDAANDNRQYERTHLIFGCNGTGKARTHVYDCSKCPGYCCSYPVIELREKDVARLAEHFGMTFEAADRKFTRSDHGYERIMRRKEDDT
ncbi:MAG: hypothetical protein AAFR23_02065, partial [Pseudomonadota bacterium]